ncbi:alanine racemase [Streptomyces sp. NPDC007088]|uniref:alanine racemase n=1 Tax=Streptomyces sp. NPDC007088 TaxID=3364773 RepID=UPI0036C72A32
MTLTLAVDTVRWEEHQRRVHAQFPGLVPVCKGNGYGFGHERLMRQASRLGMDLVAVGTVQEAARAEDLHAGDLLVLTPYRTWEAPVALSDRTIRVVSSPHDLTGLDGRRVVVELMTSMKRHGLTRDHLPLLREAMGAWRFEGFTLHLPLKRVDGLGGAEEVAAWVRCLREARLPTGQIFVSHLSPGELEALRAEFPRSVFRLRTGTKLWLGDPGATRYRSEVLDVVHLRRGDRPGGGGRRVASDRYHVLVSGGTSHGIGLRAPALLSGFRARKRHLAGLGYTALNRHLSPFVWDGERRRFARPPELQHSVLEIPVTARPPRAGAELAVQLRYTTTRPDRVVEEPGIAPVADTGGAARSRTRE